MVRTAIGSLRLYAVVTAADGAGMRIPGIRLVCHQGMAALVGKARAAADPERAALAHDRVITSALRQAPSVLPFRLGCDAPDDAAIQALLFANAAEIESQLARFRGRVEVGLKTRVAPRSEGTPLEVPFGIDRVRTLAPRPSDRRERFRSTRRGLTFEGCYLVPLQSVDEFWRILDGIRRVVPELPLLGSGPWAPYSFCDLALRRSVGDIQFGAAGPGAKEDLCDC